MAKNSGPVRTVHARTTGKERDEMIATTKAEIEKKFGQGSIMRYGDGGPELEVEAIPTGALALDAALGIGGVPRGRIVEIYGPESSGKTTLSLEILAEASNGWRGGIYRCRARARSHVCRAHWRGYRRGTDFPA